MELSKKVLGNNLELGDSREDEMNLVLGAYRSVRASIAYVSMPITTGKLFYEVLERKGVKTLAELSEKDPDAIFPEIIQPNLEMGIDAADRLRTKSKLPPIAPSVFEAKKQRWSQEEYMYLWFRVIEEMAGEMYMTDGWEYSNGGAQEFTRAMEMQFGFVNSDLFPKNTNPEEEVKRMRAIKVFDYSGKEIRLDQGSEFLTSAITDLRKRGFNTESLRNSLHKLTSIGGFLNDPSTSRQEYDQHLASPFNWADMRTNWETVNPN